MRALLLLAAVSAMAQAPNGVNFFSVEKEIELGKSLAVQFQAKSQAQPDARLQRIGDRLTARVEGPYRYQFSVYAQVSPQYEPVALPGGPVFVAQSMLSAKDDETAAILAHAIAHISLRHYTRQMTQREMMEIGKRATGIPGETPESPASQMLRMRPQFDGFEIQADRLAVKLMLDAGFAPQALLRWLESFPVSKEKLTLGDYPAPGSSARIAAVKQAIEDGQ